MTTMRKPWLVVLCVACAMVGRVVAGAEYRVEETRLGPMPPVWLPAFSTDGCHATYVISRGDKDGAVVDGVEGSEYDVILPNGATFKDGTLEYLAGRAWVLYRVKHIPVQ